MKYVPKTEKEIRSLAEELYKGQIFTDRHIRHDPQRTIKSVFMGINFLSDKDLKELRAWNTGLFYEYLSAAGPVSVNGYPTFFSFRILSKDDARRLFTMHDKIKSAVENVGTAEKKEERRKS